MTNANSSWIHRHTRLLVILAYAVFLVAVGVEGFLLYQQRMVNKAIQSQSGKLLTTFLKGDTAQVPRTPGVLVRLQNVRFKWSEKVFVDADNMGVRAVPVQGSAVDFDDLSSFLLSLQQSSVLIRPSVLEGMLNESVFNYPDSKMRDLKVELTDYQGGHAIKMTGKVNVVVWFPFSLVAELSIDHQTNTLVMDVHKLRIFGFIHASKLIKLHPFHLDQLITLPPNGSLMIAGNRFMVKPFGLFPPPRITGTLADVKVNEVGIVLTFSGKPIPAPESTAKNYVYLRGGTAQFGHFCMVDTDVLILDRNPTNYFSFSLAHYADLIPKSRIDVHDTRSVRVLMPDS